MRYFLAFLVALWLTPAVAQTPSNVNPAVGYAYTGCVEGRAVRIVGGRPSCTTTAAPSLSACGAGTLTSTANDFTGLVLIPAGLTSCTLTLTQLYGSNYFCLAQSQGGVTLTLAAPTITNTAPKTTITFPFGLSLTGAKFGYICSPG